MGFIGWTAAIGVLLMSMSLAAGWIRRLPMSTFALYLGVGIGVGPWGLHLLDVNFLRDAPWLARLTEIALIISLFIGGLKLRVPWQAPAWRVARRLAFPAMLLSIAGTAVAAHWLLPLGWPLALILAAILAPTDPVLASAIAVGDASDRDGLRVALSGEAGLNDGLAMPFLLLGLALLQQPVSWTLLGQWALLHLLWGVLAGAAVGFGFGWAVAQMSTRLLIRSRDLDPGALLAFGLIAVTYAVAQSIGALGFLAVFAAGVGMRKVEVRVMQHHGHRSMRRTEDARTLPAESVFGLSTDGAIDPGEPVRAVGRVVSDALTFGDVMEQLLAPLLVLLLGIAVARHWNNQGLAIMLGLFFVIRPVASWLATIGAGLRWERRLLLGWLGIRGIGGLNYLAYALVHGMVGPQAGLLVDVAITVITLSVVLHGFSAQPLLAWRRREIARSGGSAE